MRPTLTHLALHVSDVAAMVEFYADYCGLRVVHQRGLPGSETVWIAELGKEHAFVIVLIAGGALRNQAPNDYSHVGFAMGSKAEVDAIAAKAKAAGTLAWPSRQEAGPAGYYCGVRNPDGGVVEFSYGQPLGPGAEAGGLGDE